MAACACCRAMMASRRAMSAAGGYGRGLDGRAFERLADDDRLGDRRDRHPRHDGTRLRKDIDKPAFGKPSSASRTGVRLTPNSSAIRFSCSGMPGGIRSETISACSRS